MSCDRWQVGDITLRLAGGDLGTTVEQPCMHAVHVGDTWVGVTVGDGISVRAAMGGPEGFGAGCDGTDLSVVPAAASPAGRSLLSVTTHSPVRWPWMSAPPERVTP